MFILGTHIFIEVVGSTHRLLNMVHIFGSLTHAGVVALSIEVTKLELMLFNLFSCVEKLVAYDYMVVCAESRFESAEKNVVLLELVNSQLFDRLVLEGAKGTLREVKHITFASHGLALRHRDLVVWVLRDVVLGLHVNLNLRVCCFNLIILLAY